LRLLNPLLAGVGYKRLSAGWETRMDPIHQRISGAHLVNPIWNPGAAANWSLLFTPIFGSFLNELNWRELGEQALADQSRKWLYASIGLILCIVTARLLFAPTEVFDAAAKIVAISFVLLWYLVSSKPQVRYVKERFGDAYPRRRWGKPLLIAVVISVTWLVFTFFLGVLAQG
jgi:hypothetical protein